ncbi:MAG: endonuclease III [Nitrospira sp.]|nr:endonuclease III [Nitrospira sp.]
MKKDTSNALLIVKQLKKDYPNNDIALNSSSVFELLVATIMSAQTTDAHVNRVTEGLFKKYRTISDYAKTPLQELQQDLSSINFYNNKAKYIQIAAQMIIEHFNSKVPDTMEELITLPGVARKTANIILYNAYNKNEGIAVDTHVKRLSNRLGLSGHTDPVKIEKDLMAVIPQKEWGLFSHLMIIHGRQICNAKKPKHDQCTLFNLCPHPNP